MFETTLVRASRRGVLLAGLAAVAASTGLTATAQDAQAAFTLGACQGASGVAAQGASFQNGAQTYFRGVFNGSNGCNGTPGAPTYKANGSGNGISSMGAGGGNADLNCRPGCGTAALPAGVRDTTTSFAGTDEPPTPAQIAAMNTGGPSAADDGRVHLIPVATGANAIIVHAPEGCDIATSTNRSNGTDGTIGGADTGDGAADKTQRLRIPNELLEKAFAGDSTANTWGEIAPGISGTTTNAQQSVSGVQRQCADVPVKRIVRQDISGTTYGIKAYLALINPGRGWLTTYQADNRQWPTNGSGVTSPTATGDTAATPPQSAFCPDTAPGLLCSGKASGNGELALAVTATDGAIGYSDLATARTRGYEITPSASTQDYTFWLPVQNNPGGAPTGYGEPTLTPGAHKVGGTARGSNCQNVPVANVPSAAGSPNNDPTLGDWSKVYAAGGSVYGVCVLTYILAWDDNAPVYGNTAAEEAKARTVKDFLGTIVGSFGQQFTNVDYSPLPNPQTTPLQAIAQNAVNAIGWNKTAAAGGGGGGGTPPQTPPQTPTPTVPQVIPPVGKPSNAFTVDTGKVNAARTSAAFSLRLPGAGKLAAAATYKSGKRTIKVATVNATATAAGTAKVTVKLSSAARKALKSKKRLSLRVVFTYTPTGGEAKTVTKTVVFRAKAAKKKK